MTDKEDLNEIVRDLRERLAAYEAGEERIPVDEAFARIRRRLRLDERKPQETEDREV